MQLGQLFVYLPKSKIQASQGLENGKYKFFTSSSVQKKWINESLYLGEALVFGTGGSASLHYVNEQFSTTTDCFVVKLIDEKNVFLKYVYHFLISNFDLLENGFKGAGLKHISKSYVESITIPIPTIAEQKRIAAILDKANEIKAQRELALVKLDKLSESCYKDLFGDINANEKQFKTQRLTEFFKFKTGKLDSNAAVLNGKYPFFTCAKEDFAINEFAFDEEALLLAGNNATADYSVKHYVGKFNAYQRTYVINLQDSQNSYLFAKFSLQLMLNKLKSSSKGSGTKYLTMGIFNSLEIMVPPSNLQNEFNEKIIQIEKIKTQVLQGRNLMVSTISALQNQAFTTGFNA